MSNSMLNWDQERGHEELDIGCSHCGSKDFEITEYYSGIDRETGYADRGERGRCRDCGLKSDIGDFVRKKRKPTGEGGGK